MRRAWLRGGENLKKRYLVHVAGYNLGLIMRVAKRIAPGMDADFAIVDPAARWSVTRESTVTSAGYSIYEGWEMTGRVVHTVVRGRTVLRDGVLDDAAAGTGKYVRRKLRHAAHV